MKAVDSLYNKANIWYDQIAGIIALSKKLNQPIPDLSELHKKINQLFTDELELCTLLDNSDLIIHAEGPSTQNHSIKLITVTNLFDGVDKQIKLLAQSVLKLGMDDVKPAMKQLDIRLNGLATGSIYAGFSINPLNKSALLGTDNEIELIQSIKDVVINLSEIPNYVDEAGVNESLSEVLTDPAIRDSSLMAMYKLSPTGKQGINSIEIINPKSSNLKPGVLDTKDRSILRDSLVNKPIIKSKSSDGTFIGQLRTVDLDKTRVDLRNINVDGIDSLRCILPELTAEKGREILGRTVKVSGAYEKAPNGKPRLMHIHKIEIIGNKKLNLK